MRTIPAMMLCLLALQAGGATAEDELDWQRCTAVADCTLLKNFCGFPGGVNKKYLAKAKARQEELLLGMVAGAAYGCAKPDHDPWIGAFATCADGFCQVMYRPPAQPPKVTPPGP